MTVLLLIFAFFAAAPESRVRCMLPGPPDRAMAEATAVFSGKVIERKYIDDNLTNDGMVGKRLVVVLKVDRVWKGKIGDEVTMFTSEVQRPNGTTSFMSEDFQFEDKTEYLIYAGRKLDRLTTSACTRSRELSKAADDLKVLGTGTPRSNSNGNPRQFE